jgi:hypothetical protein
MDHRERRGMSILFGFTVRHGTTWEGAVDYEPVPDPGTWVVHLPHQCENWDIAGEQLSHNSFEGVEHDEAVKMLEAFIAEANVALAALMDKRELKPNDGER